MRTHQKYLDKVYDEYDVYRKHLFADEELPERFEESFKKIDIARSWIRDGYSDTAVLNLLKNDPSTKLQARRAREVLALAYEIFADIRLARNQDGIKQKYADEMNEAAILVMVDLKSTTDKKEKAQLWKVWKDIKTEAAKIDGALSPTIESKKANTKPTKIILKRRTVITDNKVITDNITEEAEYEIEN